MSTFTTVTEFMRNLDVDQKEQIQLLRKMIIETEPNLTEHIKWNSPSYVLNGEDRITFNVRKGYPVMIILHKGATEIENKKGHPVFNDISGLIEWKSDIRGTISFANLNDIKDKQEQLTHILKQWLAIS